MRTIVFALSAAIALFGAAQAFATPAPTVRGSDYTEASHVPHHWPPDPCVRYHTRRAHARCLARHHLTPQTVSPPADYNHGHMDSTTPH
jgi:hypothetical protein